MGGKEQPNEGNESVETTVEEYQRARTQAQARLQRGIFQLEQPGVEAGIRARDNFEGAARLLQEHPKPIEQTIADFEQIITEHQQEINRVAGLRQLLWPEEEMYFKKHIDRRLVIPQIQNDRAIMGGSYLDPISKVELGVHKQLYKDIEWLKVQITKTPDDGKRDFLTTYQNLLTHIALLEPKPERRVFYEDACDAIVEHQCSDPGTGKAALKGFAMMAIAGLAIFDLISNKGKPSIYFAAMAGLLLWLGSGASKLTLLKSDPVVELIRNGTLDEEQMSALVHMKGTQFNHFYKTIAGVVGDKRSVDEDVIQKLIDPKKRQGKEWVHDGSKAVDEAVARKFLGQKVTNIKTALLAIRENRNPGGRQFLPQFAKMMSTTPPSS